MIGAECAVEESLSVKEAFRDASVFLTGVTGYVGSLVLEHLLRTCPQLSKVYVLIRGKRNLTSKDRLEKLLSSGLFNQLWDREDLLRKIQLVEGDITQEDVGIHPDDKDELLRSTQYVVHSAAAVALDDPIKITLRNNYISTFRVLELCKKMPNLHSFVHVSTAYVNITFPRGSVVKERIYPLTKGDRVTTHDDIVTELLRLSDDEAEIKAEVLMGRFNFANTYCLGKRVTEELVADYFARGMPCCIIRPSLITGVRGDPYPGYIGNLAGGAGFAIAYALGFFEKNSAAWTGHGVCDIVPGDVVSSVVLAAAAWTGTREVMDEEIGVYHACTSTSYPISNFEMERSAAAFFEKEPPRYCLLWGSYPVGSYSYEPNPVLVYLAKMKTALKIRSLCWLLNRFGKERLASRLNTGWRAWDFGNNARYDMNLFFSVDNVAKLDKMLVKSEKKDIHLLFTPIRDNWGRYMRTYLAGVKALLLKTAVIDNSDHDFRPIPPCDPPFKLPASVERRPSTYLRSEDGGDGPSHSVARRTSSTISAAAMSGLGHQISLDAPLGEGEIYENDAAISDDESIDTNLDGIDVSTGRLRQSETNTIVKKEV